MLNGLKEIFKKYKDYIKIDLLMYAVLILSIIIYFIWTSLTR